jgi:hypothetical protein
MRVEKWGVATRGSSIYTHSIYRYSNIISLGVFFREFDQRCTPGSDRILFYKMRESSKARMKKSYRDNWAEVRRLTANGVDEAFCSRITRTSNIDDPHDLIDSTEWRSWSS